MDFENAKEELLSSLEPAEPAEKVTKRGSKDDLIEKIHKVCDENDLSLKDQLRNVCRRSWPN